MTQFKFISIPGLYQGAPKNYEVLADGSHAGFVGQDAGNSWFARGVSAPWLEGRTPHRRFFSTRKSAAQWLVGE